MEPISNTLSPATNYEAFISNKVIESPTKFNWQKLYSQQLTSTTDYTAENIKIFLSVFIYEFKQRLFDDLRNTNSFPNIFAKPIAINEANPTQELEAYNQLLKSCLSDLYLNKKRDYFSQTINGGPNLDVIGYRRMVSLIEGTNIVLNETITLENFNLEPILNFIKQHQQNSNSLDEIKQLKHLHKKIMQLKKNSWFKLKLSISDLCNSIASYIESLDKMLKIYPSFKNLIHNLTLAQALLKSLELIPSSMKTCAKSMDIFPMVELIVKLSLISLSCTMRKIANIIDPLGPKSQDRLFVKMWEKKKEKIRPRENDTQASLEANSSININFTHKLLFKCLPVMSH